MTGSVLVMLGVIWLTRGQPDVSRAQRPQAANSVTTADPVSAASSIASDTRWSWQASASG